MIKRNVDDSFLWKTRIRVEDIDGWKILWFCYVEQCNGVILKKNI